MRNSLDWTPYRRSTVGFDRLFDFLENTGSADNYPPFDIEKIADDHFRITVAVAGFKNDEIDITAQQNMLTVSGRKARAVVEGLLGDEDPTLDELSERFVEDPYD